MDNSHKRTACLPALLAALLLVCLAPAPPAAASGETALKQPADFRSCLQWALGHSPKLQRSALEIKVRRLGEWDATWAYVPSVHLYARYFFGNPQSRTNPIDIKFSTGTYNPVGAYFSVKATKLLSRLAIITHVGTIEEVMTRLAKGFIRLRSLDQQLQLAEERIELAKRMIAYTKSLKAVGSATGLQVEVAEQTMDVAQAGAMGLAAARQAVFNEIKVLMGLDPQHKLALDLENGLEQVLAAHDPTKATLKHTMRHNLDLRVQRIKQQLQDLNITMAYSKFLPTLAMTLENPDPLSTSQSDALYFSLGINLTIWEGFKQVRNVQRQKMVLTQMGLERKHKVLALTALWQGARDKVMQTRATLKLARTRARLSGLREREALIAYKSQQSTFAEFAVRRLNHLGAKTTQAKRDLEYHSSLLDLRRLTGDMLRSNVSIGSKDFE